MQNAASDTARRVAILVDAENISARQWPAIYRAAAQFGEVTMLTCHADFSHNRHPAWLDICRQNGGNAEMTLATGSDKNGTDIALAIEAMEIVHAGAVEAIAIVSGDSDFAPLARKLTASGVLAIGIGHTGASSGLQRAFDHFVSLSAAPSVPAPAPEALTPDQLIELAGVIEHLSQEDPSHSVLLSRLGLVLRKEKPDLAALLAKGKLRKVLRRHDLVEEHGQGTGIRVSLRRAEPQRQSA